MLCFCRLCKTTVSVIHSGGWRKGKPGGRLERAMSCHQDILSAHSPLFFSELSLGTKHKIAWAKLVILVANCTHKAQTQCFGRARQRGSLNRGSMDDQSFLCESPLVSYPPSCDTLEHLWCLWISRSGSCVPCWMWTMRGVKRQTSPGAM